jgi:hypothetical protein
MASGVPAAQSRSPSGSTLGVPALLAMSIARRRCSRFCAVISRRSLMSASEVVVSDTDDGVPATGQDIGLDSPVLPLGKIEVECGETWGGRRRWPIGERGTRSLIGGRYRFADEFTKCGLCPRARPQPQLPLSETARPGLMVRERPLNLTTSG